MERWWRILDVCSPRLVFRLVAMLNCILLTCVTWDVAYDYVLLLTRCNVQREANFPLWAMSPPLCPIRFDARIETMQVECKLCLWECDEYDWLVVHSVQIPLLCVARQLLLAHHLPPRLCLVWMFGLRGCQSDKKKMRLLSDGETSRTKTGKMVR